METRPEKNAAEPTPVLFYAEMRPYRSLSQTGFWVLMLAIGGVSFVAGTLFLLAGAWPIFGFFGLDVLLVYIFFRLNYRGGRAFETLTLTERELLLRKVNPKGIVWSYRFEPYWLRVEMENPPRPGSQLTLTTHGETVEIGAFLTAAEKLDLAQAIRDALRARHERSAPGLDLA
ncbi:MAG: DUF2244 domain-containing protein [Pseudomonadota bacterium]